MTLYETSGHLILKSNVTYELLVLQLGPNRRDGEGTWRMDGRVEEKQRGSEAGRRK